MKHSIILLIIIFGKICGFTVNWISCKYFRMGVSWQEMYCDLVSIFKQKKREICFYFRNPIASLLEICRNSIFSWQCASVWWAKYQEGRPRIGRCYTNQKTRNASWKPYAKLSWYHKVCLTLWQIFESVGTWSRRTKISAFKCLNCTLSICGILPNYTLPIFLPNRSPFVTTLSSPIPERGGERNFHKPKTEKERSGIKVDCG